MREVASSVCDVDEPVDSTGGDIKVGGTNCEDNEEEQQDEQHGEPVDDEDST